MVNKVSRQALLEGSIDCCTTISLFDLVRYLDDEQIHTFNQLLLYIQKRRQEDNRTPMRVDVVPVN